MKGEKKKADATPSLLIWRWENSDIDWWIDRSIIPATLCGSSLVFFVSVDVCTVRTDGRTGTHLMWGKRSRFSGKGNEGIPSAPFRQSTWGKGESSHRGTRFSNMSKRGSRSMDGEFEPRPQASSSFPTSKSPGHVLCMPMVRLLTWLALALPGKKKNKIKGVKKGTHRWN